jgi:hypothetical protein
MKPYIEEKEYDVFKGFIFLLCFWAHPPFEPQSILISGTISG